MLPKKKSTRNLDSSTVLLSGPLSQLYSHKSVGLVASVTIFLGLVLSSLVDRGWQLFLTYSVLCGESRFPPSARGRGERLMETRGTR